MTTLAIMKARIAEEIYREDLGTAIAREIESAIKFYQPRRLFFSEAYSFTFNTVSGQESYGAATAPELANLISIDFVHIAQNGSVNQLSYASPGDIDQITFLPSSGVPSMYAYMAGKLRLYPVPNAALPVRIAGVIPVGVPISDAMTGSPWMDFGEELIRSRAKRNLYLHSLGDQPMAAAMKAAEDEAYETLIRETSSRMQVNSFVPYCV